MFAPTPESNRLTVDDYDEILAAGNEAAQTVNAFLWLARDKAEADLFLWGTDVDAAGRYLVVKLLLLGYPRVVAMRAAIQMEQRSITVIPPADGWRS